MDTIPTTKPAPPRRVETIIFLLDLGARLVLGEGNIHVWLCHLSFLSASRNIALKMEVKVCKKIMKKNELSEDPWLAFGIAKPHASSNESINLRS